MKKRAIFIAVLAVIMLGTMSQRAVASACISSSNNGSVVLSIPTLPGVGSYHVWTRMQASDSTHNQYELQINNQNCYQVGGASLTPGKWSWVSFQNGDLAQNVTTSFNRVSGNTATLIGTQAGVKVDRVLFVQNDCIPVDLGTNCQTDTVPIASNSISTASEVPPLSSGPVSGLIIPSQTITLNPSLIDKVIYYVDGAAVPTAKNNNLDTTLLTNGTHRIGIQIIKTNGTVVNEATTIEVENSTTAWSPIRRIWRLHESSIVTISTIVGLVLLVTAVYTYIRHIKLKKRLMTFHGF